MMRKDYEWNPVFNLVMQIKDKYLNKCSNDKNYFERKIVKIFNKELNAELEKDLTCLEYWIFMLNEQQYIDFIEKLQVNQYKDRILLRYGLAEIGNGLWDDPNSIYRECRSIEIDIVNDEIVLAPYRKFFNIDEVEENKLSKVLKEIENALELGQSVEYSNKLDGSMQNSRYYRDEIILSGSQAIDKSQSWRLEESYNKFLTDNHKKMIKDNPYVTFSFESISKKDEHVVDYSDRREGLYLIGIRDITDGTQYSYAIVKEYADKYNIPMTEIETKTLEEILEERKTFKSNEKEGWVINLSGRLIKLKVDDYITMHRMIGKISSINEIIRQIGDSSFDDFLSRVPSIYRKRIIEIHDKIVRYIKNTNEKVELAYSQAPKDDKKMFMIWIDNNVDKDIRGYVRNKYLGIEFNVIKKGNRLKSANEMGLYEMEEFE